MTTTVVFDLLSDDPDLKADVEAIRDDPVQVWRLAVFCAQMQLEKAVAASAVRDHYARIHKRARATRLARTKPRPAGQPDWPSS